MKRKDYTLLIMWFCLFAGVIVLALIRFGRGIGVWQQHPVNFDVVFVGMYILWMFFELSISKKDVSTEGKRTSDSGTCQLYGVGQMLTILTALGFPSLWKVPDLAHFFGMAFFLSGVCYRLWAILTLGKFYSHKVRIVSQHEIVVSGPYRATRHPAYTGMLISNAAIVLYFFNWVTLCAFIFMLLPAIILRIVIEERTLFEIAGYAEYAEKRKRLLPGIW